MKAHSRRLLFHDINVLRGWHDPYTPENPGQGKPSLLVDPPRDVVLVHEDIARHRGLCGFNDFTEFLERKLAHDTCYYGRIVNGIFVEGRTGDEEKFFKRRAKIADEDRQCAELSITHDGEYAMAVCMACVEGGDSKQQKPPIVDDGSGDPLHEPEWGDEGFFDGSSTKSVGMFYNDYTIRG